MSTRPPAYKPPVNTYDIGDVVVVRGEFVDPRKALKVDPDNVTCQFLRQGETTPSTVTVDRVSQGVYEARIDVDLAGTWDYRIAGTGTNKAAVEGSFVVRPSKFVPAP